MRVGICGLGLIGGSLALALRGAHEVRGYDVADVRLDGVARVATPEALLPADIVVVATPFAAVVPTLARLAPLAADAVLLDVASVKRPIAAFAETAPPTVRIVGGHPMAGATATGAGAADPNLFRDRPFFLVPTARSDERAMAVAGDLARAVGAVPTVCSAVEHDRMVALLSGAPLLLARALARAAGASASFGGPGFRDATRLAATPDDLAAAILGANADNVREALAKVRAELDALEHDL